MLLFSHSVVSDSLQPQGLQASLSSTISWRMLKLMSIELMMPSNHCILCRPLLLLCLIFPSNKVFSHKSALHIRRPKYWSLSFNISPSKEYSELISFRIDWFALLGVQGALMCLVQHHSSKASVLQCSAFFMVQLWHPYMTTGKTITLSIGTFVSKVMSLLFDTLSRFGIVFFPWASIFYFMTAVSVLKKIVFLRAQENSLSRFSFFPPSISLKWWDRMLWS